MYGKNEKKLQAANGYPIPPEIVGDHERGVRLHVDNKLDEAEQIYLDILKRRYDSHATRTNLAQLYMTKKEPKRALEIMEHVMNINEMSLEMILFYMHVLRENKREDKAIEIGKKGLERFPESADLWFHYALALRNQLFYDEALAAYEKSLHFGPNSFSTCCNLGLLYRDYLRYDDSEKTYARALALNPFEGRTMGNMSMLHLFRGDFDLGWAQYTCRWRSPDFHEVPPDFYEELAYWYPQDEPDEARPPLIVWREQGLGDEIIFCSHLTRLLKSKAPLYLHPSLKMAPLFKRSFPQIEVLNASPPAGWLKERGVRHHVPMGDLMRQAPHNVVYPRERWLEPDPVLRNNIRSAMLRASGGKPLVALSWQTIGPNAYRRNMSLKLLIKMVYDSGAVPIAVQYLMNTKEVVDIQNELGLTLYTIKEIDIWENVDGLAAMIDAMDAVVSIANINGHLAGALGKPGLIAVCHSSDWRWGTTNRSPFYKSLKLFRQEKITDNWDGVMERIAKELPIILKNGSTWGKQS